MKWIRDYNESDSFEEELSAVFKEKMVACDDFCSDIWSSMANVIWVNPDRAEKYSTSFRGAGGVVSSIIGRGDYMDWYCSGSYEYVSIDIKKTLKQSGWIPYNYNGDKL